MNRKQLSEFTQYSGMTYMPVRSLEIKQYSRYPGRLGKLCLFPLRRTFCRRLPCRYTSYRLWICVKPFLGGNERTGFFFSCSGWLCLYP